MKSSEAKKSTKKEITEQDEFELYLKRQCMKTTFNGIEIESFAWYKSMLGIR